jgi:glutamate decarboxylase
MPLHDRIARERHDERLAVRPDLSIDDNLVEVPRFRLADGGLSSHLAYQLIHDELMLDANARLNLATFVTTWMDTAATRLLAETIDRNLIDKDQYAVTADFEARCVNMLAELWSAPADGSARGCSTVGSSEACMLAGLAFKFRWRDRRGDDSARPNLVMGANVQVVWEKFCRYWEVEARQAPVRPGRTHLTAEAAAELCDENTIGVVTVFGSTYDGSYEPVAEIAAALDRLESERGLDVPIHVDAATGAFIAPFLDPDLEWDFRIPRVKSINASGHKYGLVYPGVGWILWRDEDAIPDQLVFNVDYLGGDMPTYTLNFSRPGAEVVGQYYCFLHLGREGYRRVQSACRENARWIAEKVAEMGPFELISDGSHIPAFAFKLRDDVEGYTVYDVSARIRQHGWQVPAYSFPPDMEELSVLRVVVRNGFGRALAERLVHDLRRAVEDLGAGRGRGEREQPAFHH